MKIVFINDKFPPDVTGVGNYVFNLAKKMKELGQKIEIISATKDKEKEGREKYDGITVNRVYSPPFHYLRNYISIYNPHTVGKITMLLKEIKPDVCHFFNIHESISYYLLKKSSRISKSTFWFARDVMSFSYNKLTHFIYADKSLAIPQKIDYRLSYFDLIKQAKKSFNPFRNILIRHYLSYSDGILSVSEALKEAMRQNGIENNINVSYSGVDIGDYNIGNEEILEFKQKYGLINKKIIFIGGRLTGEKGTKQAIEAFNIILAKYPNAILYLAAKKDNYTTEILDYAQKSGINEEKIILSDWLTNREMKIVLSASDIILNPSLCLDAFPKINLEAMAAKKPVVATCFGGTPEVVSDGVTGYIINPLDINLMAEKILELLQDEARARSFGEAGYNRVRDEFNLEIKARELVDFYKSVLEKKGEKINCYN